MLGLLILSVLVNLALAAMIFFYYIPTIKSSHKELDTAMMNNSFMSSRNLSLNSELESAHKRAKQMEENLEKLSKLSKRKGK